MPKLLIGIVSFQDLAVLKKALKKVEQIAVKNSATLAVLDNAGDKDLGVFLQENSSAEYHRHPRGNVGYGAGYNYLLQQHPGHDFYLVLTSDVLLDEEGFQKVFEAFKQEVHLKMAAGKLHRWDEQTNKQTKIIDSLGIVGSAKHHFWDLGHGEQDRGQYDDILGKVFGISGAVFLLRLEGETQIFDEDFFMYKEDIDLAYRLRWAGQGLKVFPTLWAWHIRSVRAGEKKSAFARRQSYKNHLLLLKKNWSEDFSFAIKFGSYFFEFQKAVYMLFRDPVALWQGIKMLRCTVSQNPQKISAKKMEKILKFNP